MEAIKARLKLAKMRIQDIWQDFGLDGKLVVTFALFFLLSALSGVLRYILGG